MGMAEGGGGGGISACSFSRTAAGNRAVGSSSTSAFFEARCKKKPADVMVDSYFSANRSLILNWIICHRGRMHCNKLNNGLFHDVVTQVVDRLLTASLHQAMRSTDH